MYLNSNDIVKIIVLINAKNNGWTVLCKDETTFYLVKNRNKNSNKKDIKFSKEMMKLCKKPLNFDKVLDEIEIK